MYLSISNITRTKHIATSEDLGEFELTFEPVNNTLVKVEGDKAVIGYIAHDSDCENPITSNDCMGEFITGDRYSKNFLPHLGMTETPYRGDIYRDLECDGVYEGAIALLRERLIHDQDFLDYCKENFDEARADVAFMEECIDLIDWDDIPLWLEPIWNSAMNDAWDQLYDQGKIGTYLAVPCYSYDSRAYTCALEDCNAVWIPTKGGLDNIIVEGEDYQTTYAKAVKYADGILEEYSRWLTGETYGIVVETYTREDSESDWNLVESNHCWGFIGSEYAEEEVKGLFEYTCESYLKEPT